MVVHGDSGGGCSSRSGGGGTLVTMDSAVPGRLVVMAWASEAELGDL